MAFSIHTYAQTVPYMALPQFLFPDFTKSSVKLRAGQEAHLLLNYNTVTGKMIFLQEGIVYDMINPGSVDTIYLQNSCFVPVDTAFYELLVNGDNPFYIQYKSDISFQSKPSASMTTQVTASNYHAITGTSAVYLNQELPAGYDVKRATVYWVKVNEKMYRFVNERQLLRIFPEKATELKLFIKESRLKIEKREDLIKLGNYCNGLMK